MSFAIGNSKTKVAPIPGSLCTHRRPPRYSTICRLMGRPKSRTLRLFGHRVAGLAEFLEDDFLVFDADAGPVVGDAHPDHIGGRADLDDDAAFVDLDELGGVGEQVDQHLHQPVAIGVNRRHAPWKARLESDVLRAEDLHGRVDRILDHRLEIERGNPPLGTAGLELGEVQHLVDEAGQSLAFLDNDREELLPLGRVELQVVVQDLGKRPDRRERRAQLVRDRGDEVVLQAVELLQALVGRAKLGRGRFELGRFLAQLVAVGDDLRGLVEQRAHLVAGSARPP